MLNVSSDEGPSSDGNFDSCGTYAYRLEVMPFSSPLSFRHDNGALRYLLDISAYVNGITILFNF